MNLHFTWGGGDLGEKISDITSTGTKVAEGTSGVGGGECGANIRPYGYHIGYHVPYVCWVERGRKIMKLLFENALWQK